jgi:hypothetical protein
MGKWSDKLNAYGEKSQEMAKLQQCLENAIGPVLSKKSRVANYRHGTLVIETASATLATRLNYLKMEILSQFRQAGMVDCAQVKITTNPDAQQRLTPPSVLNKTESTTGNKRQMSSQTAQQLQELAKNAPPSLQTKLLKLATHAQTTDKKNDA